MNCPHCGHPSCRHLALEDSIARYASPFGFGCQREGCPCLEQRPPTSFLDRWIMGWGIVLSFPTLVRLHPRHDVRQLGAEARGAIRRIWRAR